MKQKCRIILALQFMKRLTLISYFIKSKELQYTTEEHLPANTDATAAIRNETMTAGPATLLATCPAST